MSRKCIIVFCYTDLNKQEYKYLSTNPSSTFEVGKEGMLQEGWRKKPFGDRLVLCFSLPLSFTLLSLDWDFLQYLKNV